MVQAKLKNFTKKELACRCCGELIVDDEALVALQAFRYYLNRKFNKNIRLNPTCGTRCPEHNQEVGGAKGSYHLKGKAFDLTSPDVSHRKLYDEAVVSLLFSTVIRYDKSCFIHVDTRNRDGYEIKNWSWDK